MKGYIETIKQFYEQKTQRIVAQLKKEFEGEPVNSWPNLIEDIKSSSKLRKMPNSLVIAMEYQCPTGGMSIDLMLAFVDKKGQRRAFAVEVKNWTDDYIQSLNLSNNRRRDNTLLPQLQILGQVMSFGNYTDIGNLYSVTPCVYVKCSELGLEILKNAGDNTSVQFCNDLQDIFEEIEQLIDGSRNDFQTFGIVSELREACYQPSVGVIRAMQDLVKSRQAFILTNAQQKAVKDILGHIEKGDKKVIRVVGAAGSGKTAILIQLFLELSKAQGKRPILITGAYNTDYYRSIFPDSQYVFEFSRALRTILRGKEGRNCVVLMDEAQHNDQGEVSQIIEANATLVVCYDETQVIRAVNCLDELERLQFRKDFLEIKLTDSYRYNGSKIAETNIRNFLAGKPVVQDELFKIDVCNDFDEFQSKLTQLIENEPNSTIATVGLLCRNLNKFVRPHNTKSILQKRWYDKAECDWMEYVNQRNYNPADSIWVGTWWMQGLDVDYIALIVGDDAELTPNGFKCNVHETVMYQTVISIAEKLALPTSLYNSKSRIHAENVINYMDRQTDKQLKAEFETMCTNYIQHYYYIMMTRAKKGCLVYFSKHRT